MTKWLALALGALLALGGALSIWNGADVIQSERGWAAVISGSVALTGGIVVFALFVLIREVQALRAAMALSSRVATIPPPPPRAVPVAVEEPKPAAPVSQEAPVAAAPAPIDSAPAAPPAAEPPPLEPPAPEKPPHETLVFEQVFPPVPVAPTPVVPASERFRFRSGDAAIGLAAGAAAIGMFARSRAGSSAQEASPPEPPAEPASQPQAEARVEQVPSAESVLERLEEALLEPQPDAAPTSAEARTDGVDAHGADGQGAEISEPQLPEPEAHQAQAHDGQAPEAQVDDAQTGEPKGGEGLGEAGKEDPTLSPGYAWLERALAREEGRKSPALDWLRSRPPTELLIDPAAPAPEASPETPADLSGHEAEPVHEVAPEPEAAAEAAPPAQNAPAQEEPAQAPEAAPEPGVLGRYSSGGSDYTLYSDGSIDAQTQEGLFRFASMAELRAYIEGQNAQS